MNYKKHYMLLINKAKSENRMKGMGVYYENHHVIPDFMFKNRKRRGPAGHLEGDPNDANNLVLLTAREHFVSHILLAKAHKETRYYIQSCSALQFFFSKVINRHARQISGFNASDSKKYEYCRKLSSNAISKCRKGTFPAMDSQTKEPVGSVSNKHPNVLSGKWVHITKGRVVTDEELANRKSQIGSENSNYKEMTQERKNRLFALIPSCLEDHHLKLELLQVKLKEEFAEFKKISLVWVTNNFGSYSDLVDQYNEKTNSSIKYHPYHRSKKQRGLSSSTNKLYQWVTNGEDNLRIKLTEEIPNGYVRGRK